MLNIDYLLRDEDLRDVFFGLGDIPRMGWKNRGVPLVFIEDDFAHSLVVEKGNCCVAARHSFERRQASIQGFIHEFPEYKYGDKIPGEVDLADKKREETRIMRDICRRSKDLEHLFEVWEDFYSQRTAEGEACFYVDKVANSPVAVAYRNNMDSIVEYYKNNTEDFEKLLSLPRYEGVSRGDVFDVMKDSLSEFHPYAKSKVAANSVFVDVVDEVEGMKTKDVSKIFEVFYRGLAGDKWSEVSGREFYVDKLTVGKKDLERLRVSRGEILRLLD